MFSSIEIPAIGPVVFKRSKRAKRVNISVSLCEQVKVTVPYRVSLRKAAEFVRENIRWIYKHSLRMQNFKQKYIFIDDKFTLLQKQAAKEKLILRLRYLAKQHGFFYNRACIRNQKTLWGSCSAKNTISLNMKLIRLPDELIDYVILHELTHTKIKSHSRVFWKELDKLVGNAKALDKKLKIYHLELK